MNPKIKLLFLILVSSSVFLSGSILFTVFLLVAAITAVMFFKIRSNLSEWIKPIIIISVFIILFQTFAYQGFGFSYTGLGWGLTVSFRLLILVLLVFVFISTTPPRNLVKGFDFLPKEISFMLMLAFRFFYVIGDDLKKIFNAQKSRGLNFRRINFLKTYFPILVPLFSKSLENSRQLALSMQSRGFEME